MRDFARNDAIRPVMPQPVNAPSPELDAGMLAGAVAVAAVEDLAVVEHDGLEQAVLADVATSSPNSGLSTSSSGKRLAAGW